MNFVPKSRNRDHFSATGLTKKPEVAARDPSRNRDHFSATGLTLSTKKMKPLSVAIEIISRRQASQSTAQKQKIYPSQSRSFLGDRPHSGDDADICPFVAIEIISRRQASQGSYSALAMLEQYIFNPHSVDLYSCRCSCLSMLS